MLRSLLLALGAMAATAVAQTGEPQCNRTLLEAVTEQYVTTQSTGLVTNFTLLSYNISYSENEVALNIANGIIQQPMKIDHARSIHDPVLCGTFTELIVANSPHPYVIGTRMLLTNGVVTTIESVVSDQGDWLFNATGYLYWNSFERWNPIPEGMRDTREVIQHAGDAYFERFHNASVDVPFGTPCARLEGGAYTSRTGNITTNTCNLGIPTNITVTNKRYIVDEAMGVVVMFLGFPGLDRSQGQTPMPDSHMFRVEGGEIRYIHTISSCVNAGCGLNGTMIPSRRSQVRHWERRMV